MAVITSGIDDIARRVTELGSRINRRRKPPQTRSEQGMNPVQAVQKLDTPLHMSRPWPGMTL
jgi:hypothetical protein